MNLLHRALHRVIAERRLYYHGTSSKLVPSILKHGFDPDPKRKVWDEAKDAASESYHGTYLTANFMTAWLSAGTARDKFGGHRAIVETQLETRTGLFDEDEIPTLFSAMAEARAFPTDDTMAGKILSAESYLVEQYIPKIIDTWFALARRKFGTLGPEITRKLQPILRRWVFVGLEAIVRTGNYSSAAGDKEYRTMVDAVVKSLRGWASKRPADLIRNLRIDRPIRFSGANKILSAIELIERKPGSATPIEVVPLYGKPSRQLLQDIGYIGEYELKV